MFVQESLLDADHHVAVALGAANTSGSAASVFHASRLYLHLYQVIGQ